MAEETAARLILVVEDRASSAAALEMVIGAIASAAVRTFPNGAAAWRFLDTGEGAKVSAVVTDWDMPVLGGLELIQRMRSSDAHRATPVIVISGTTESTAPTRALEAGANAFFAKPWSPGRVRATLEQLLYERDGKGK